MDFRLLDTRNAAPGTAILVSAAWLTEQFMGAQTWISQIPFGWMALILFAFWLGYDLYHPQGRLRNLIRYVMSIGRFGDIYNQTSHRSLGIDYGGQQSFISIYIPFEFRENTTVDAIRLTSEVYRVSGEITGPPWSSYSWKIAEGERYQKGDFLEIAIAHIPYNPAVPGVYGDLNIAGCYLARGSAHAVKVEIFAGKKRQSEEILIFMPQDSIYAISGKRPGQVDPGSRFIALKKGESLFLKDNA